MHNEYWTNVKHEAAANVCALFDNCRTDIADIIGDDNGIDSVKDAKKVLAYILRHGNCHEQACAIVSLGGWIHAYHELNEHGAAYSASATNNKA